MPTTTSPRPTRNALLSSASALYEKLDIKPAAQAQLEASAGRIFDLGRRTTEQTFELGDQLQQAAQLLPDDGFDAWIGLRCGLKPRSARNYMAVYRNLSDFRDDLVDLSIGSTVLFYLSSAAPEQVREAIAYADAHGRLQVSDVKTILAAGESAEGKPSQVDVFSVGGASGLKAMVAAKTRDGVKALHAHVAEILEAIGAALEKPRVIKETLAKMILELARLARQELESLALFVEADLQTGRSARPTMFPAGSEWAQVHDTLDTLGSVESWPKAATVRTWLRTEVVPVLEWAISRERKPKWPLARTETADVDVGVNAEFDTDIDVSGLIDKARASEDDAPLAEDAGPDIRDAKVVAPPMLA